MAASLLSAPELQKNTREAWLVAGNYPHDSMYLLQHLFQNWFRSLDLGRLCAGAVMMALVLLCLIGTLQRLLRGREG